MQDEEKVEGRSANQDRERKTEGQTKKGGKKGGLAFTEVLLCLKKGQEVPRLKPGPRIPILG